MKRLELLVGASVFALAAPFAALAGTVYIPDGNANSVLVVEAETGEITSRIEGLEAVHGLGGAPGSEYLVAGSFTEIDREDMGQMDKPKSVSKADHAAHHAKKPKGAMPDNMGLSLVSIIDRKSGEIVRRIEVPGAVHHTAVSPDGRYAVATHPAGGGVSLIDLETLSFKGFIATGPMPNYAVFAPDGKSVYVSNSGNGTLSQIDVEEGFVTRNARIAEAPEHLVLNGEGSAAFVIDGDAGGVVRVDLASGKVTDKWQIGGELHGIDLSERGDTLFVAGQGSDRLVAIDLASEEQRSAPLAPAPYHLTVVPGTGKLFVSSREEPKVWIVDQATMKAEGEIKVEDVGHQMVALP